MFPDGHGSETVTITLTYLFFELAADADACAALRHELDRLYAQDGRPDDRALSRLGHLDACINETMRLYPPLASGLPRVTPTRGLRLASGVVVPGHGGAGALVHRLPRYAPASRVAGGMLTRVKTRGSLPRPTASSPGGGRRGSR